MHKYKLLLIALMVNFVVFAQVPGVGIDTANPQGIFNIDGGKDNPKTGSGHTITQQANDFTVLTNGNMGIGTIVPTQKLHIEGNTRMNGMIYDGINAAGVPGQILSNNGTEVRWEKNITVTPTILGVMPGTNVPINNLNEPTYLYVHITLPPGEWMVPTGSVARIGSRITSDVQLWVRYFFSDSDVSFALTSDVTPLGARGDAGSIFRGSTFGMVYGDFIINNTSGADKTYYLWALLSSVGPETTPQRITTVFGGNSHERWIYANPIVR